jgi:NNP family nitrate/nitrite transporter-like MFS transporter
VGLATTPTLGVGTVLLFLAMALLGMGNGSVFQLVPQRFSAEIGVVTGIVGAAGGIGGFLLPTVFGAIKGTTGSFSGSFLLFAFAAATCSLLVVYVGRLWRAEAGELPTGPVAITHPATLDPEPVS